MSTSWKPQPPTPMKPLRNLRFMRYYFIDFSCWTQIISNWIFYCSNFLKRSFISRPVSASDGNEGSDAFDISPTNWSKRVTCISFIKCRRLLRSTVGRISLSTSLILLLSSVRRPDQQDNCFHRASTVIIIIKLGWNALLPSENNDSTCFLQVACLCFLKPSFVVYSKEKRPILHCPCSMRRVSNFSRPPSLILEERACNLLLSKFTYLSGCSFL